MWRSGAGTIPHQPSQLHERPHFGSRTRFAEGDAHIEIPVQAGDDDVLRNMKRGYTQAEFIRLTERIRAIVPDAAINGDVIVGFPGETDAQFEETVAVLQAVRHSRCI